MFLGRKCRNGTNAKKHPQEKCFPWLLLPAPCWPITSAPALSPTALLSPELLQSVLWTLAADQHPHAHEETPLLVFNLHISIFGVAAEPSTAFFTDQPAVAQRSFSSKVINSLEAFILPLWQGIAPLHQRISVNFHLFEFGFVFYCPSLSTPWLWLQAAALSTTPRNPFFANRLCQLAAECLTHITYENIHRCRAQVWFKRGLCWETRPLLSASVCCLLATRFSLWAFLTFIPRQLLKWGGKGTAVTPITCIHLLGIFLLPTSIILKITMMSSFNFSLWVYVWIFIILHIINAEKFQTLKTWWQTPGE